VPGRRVVFTFGLLTALVSAGYGVMFTVLDDFRDKFGISEAALGIVVAIGFLSSFLAQVFLAPIADRGHARHLVYVGLVFNIVGLVAMAYSTRLMPMLIARFVMGVGAGMAQPAVRRIVILADPDNLGQNLGRLLAADVGGFAFGPALSAVIAGPFGIAAPFLVIAAATVACLPIVHRVKVTETPDDGGERFAFALLRHRQFMAAVVFGAAVFLMIGTFDTLWVIVLRDMHTADWIGNVGITLFALPLVVLGSAGGRLAQRVGPFRLGALGLLIAAGFMFLYGHLPTGEVMLAVGLFHGVSDGLTVSSSGVAVGLVTPVERQAGAQGLLGGVQTLTAGLTALVAGAVYQHGGRSLAFGACAAVMVMLVGLGAWLAGSSWSIRGEQPASQSRPITVDALAAD